MTKPAMPPNMTQIEHEAWLGLHAAQHLAHSTATDAGRFAHLDPTSLFLDLDTGASIKREVLEAAFAEGIIRILDTAAALDLDVPGALIEKNRYNRQRADHKLASRAGDNGKKY